MDQKNINQTENWDSRYICHGIGDCFFVCDALLSLMWEKKKWKEFLC